MLMFVEALLDGLFSCLFNSSTHIDSVETVTTTVVLITLFIVAFWWYMGSGGGNGRKGSKSF